MQSVNEKQGSDAEVGHVLPSQPKASRMQRLQRSPYYHFVVYCIVFLILLCSCLGAWLAYRAEESNSPFKSSEFIDSNGDLIISNGIILSTSIQSIDLVASTMKMLVTPLGFGNYTNAEPDPDLKLPNGSPFPPIGAVSTDVFIYQDGAANSSLKIRGAQVNNVVQPTFSFTINLVGNQTDANSKIANAASTVTYPFDVYYTMTSFGVLDANNDTVPIAQVTLTGNVQGYSLDASDISTEYVGTTAGFDYEQGRLLTIYVSRAAAIKAFAIIIAITMWLVTSLMMYIALLGTIFGHVLPPNFVALPATILFALPAMRNIMPSVPPFGTYLDVWTLLLCETVTGLVFFLMVVQYMRRINLPSFPPKKQV